MLLFIIIVCFFFFFFFQAEDGIRDKLVTGVQTCALPISMREYVRKQVAANVDVIKIFGSLSSRAGGGPTYTLEQMKAAVDEAHKAGKPVAEIGRASCRERV